MAQADIQKNIVAINKIDLPTDWENDKPHVIYGNVGIVNGAKLKIKAGSRS